MKWPFMIKSDEKAKDFLYSLYEFSIYQTICNIDKTPISLEGKYRLDFCNKS